MDILKKFDIFPKLTDQDIRIKTNSGALMSIITLILMALIGLHELHRFLFPRTFESIQVDTSSVTLNKQMAIAFNISIAVPCQKIVIEAFDFEKNVQSSKSNQIQTDRLDLNGISVEDHWISLHKPKKKEIQFKQNEEDHCGPCYGAGVENQCCNSCDDVIDAFKAKGWSIAGLERWKQCVEEGYVTLRNETCRIKGEFKVPQVSGEFHITLGDGVKLGKKKLIDISKISRTINFSHSIQYLEFGPRIARKSQPLDMTTVRQEDDQKTVFIYNLDVVRCKWISRRGFEVHTFRYSPSLIRRNLRGRQATLTPGIYFSYRIAPYSIVSIETAYNFWEFVTSCCAILGGAFVCASLAEKFLFGALSTMEAKSFLGKQN